MNLEQHAPDNILEAEIAELSKQIEAKRGELERERGIVQEKEVVHEVVTSHVYPAGQTSQVPHTGSSASTAPAGDYLAGLDDDTVAAVNDLIARVPELGIKKVIALAQNGDPLILDAFHDALVDRLYDELRDRGIVK